jgi:hypothetical protein
MTPEKLHTERNGKKTLTALQAGGLIFAARADAGRMESCFEIPSDRENLFSTFRSDRLEDGQGEAAFRPVQIGNSSICRNGRVAQPD